MTFRQGIASVAVLLVLAACSSTPKKKSTVIYYEKMEGQITRVLADRIVVKTEAGDTVVVVFTEDTEVKKDGDDAHFKDLKEKESVRITGNTDSENDTFVAGVIDTGDKGRAGMSPSGTMPTNPATPR